MNNARQEWHEGGDNPVVVPRPQGSVSDALTRTLEAERDRWFVWMPVAFGIGIAVYFALPSEPSLLTALAPVGIAVACRLVWTNGLAALLIGATTVLATLGFATAKLRTEWVRAPVLSQPLRIVEIRGWIETAQHRLPKGTRVTIRVSSLGKLPQNRQPYRVRITTLDRDPRLRSGVAIRVLASLAQPPMPAQPGGYDFARRAWFLKLGAIGFARQRIQIDPDAGYPPWDLRLNAQLQRLRQSIGERVAHSQPGETGGIATALITGDRGRVSEETLATFRSAGLLHILAISGMHMSIMAGTIFLLVRLLLAAVPGLALHRPIKKWAAVAALIGALSYLMISGASYSTQRACIMICIMFVAVLLERRAIALRNVAMAAVVLLIAFPESLFDISFQMSFAAAVALVSIYETWRDRVHRHEGKPTARGTPRPLLFLLGIAGTTIIASLAVAPFGIYHFHQSQQYAILGNLLALPLVNFIVMPSALLTLVALPLGLEDWPLALMAMGINLVLSIAGWVASLPGATVRIPAIPDSAMALIVLGGLWLLLWRTRWRFLGFAPLVLGVAFAPTLTRPDVLIARDGRMLAVRDANSLLQAMPFRGKGFEIGRWLEADGDARAARDAINKDAFRCDGIGCRTYRSKLDMTVSWHPAALRDDCRRSRILVLRFVADRKCTGPELIIDRRDLERYGSHAVYLGATGLRLATVAHARGRRPWSMIGKHRAGRRKAERMPTRRKPAVTGKP